MLADIGLTRGDLRDAFAEPPWRDPSDVLARRAAERRVSRRAQPDCVTRNRLRRRCSPRRRPLLSAGRPAGALLDVNAVTALADPPIGHVRNGDLPSRLRMLRPPPPGGRILFVRVAVRAIAPSNLLTIVHDNCMQRTSSRIARTNMRCGRVDSQRQAVIGCSVLMRLLGVVRAGACCDRDRAGARAIGFRPAGRRLCALHGAVRRSRGLRRALRARRALPGLDLFLSGHGRDRRQQLATCWLKNQVPPLRGEFVLRVGRQGRRRGRDARRARSRTRSIAIGGDYRNFEIPSDPNGEACKQACEGENRCRAWTYVRPGYLGPAARCYLKDKITPPRRKPCCMSGVVR